jgi:hypothetical protein
MSKKYIKLGATIDDLDKVTRELSGLLQVTFTEDESSYWGIYNAAMLSPSEKIKIGSNFVDDDWTVEDRKDSPLIVDLNGLQNPEETMQLLCDSLSYLEPLNMTESQPGISSKNYVFDDGEFNLVSEHFYKKKPE